MSSVSNTVLRSCALSIFGLFFLAFPVDFQTVVGTLPVSASGYRGGSQCTVPSGVVSRCAIFVCLLEASKIDRAVFEWLGATTNDS